MMILVIPYLFSLTLALLHYSESFGFSLSARNGRAIFHISSPVTVNSGLGNVTQITKIDLAEVVSPSRENEMKCESQLKRLSHSSEL